MRLFVCGLALLLSYTFMLGQAPPSTDGKAASKESPRAEWRQSPIKLREELDRYVKTATAFPGSSFNFMAEGGVVPVTWEVMRLYGGPIEWEGTFEGFEDKGNLKGRPKKIKLASVGMMFHVYPTDGAVSQWEKLPVNSTVRYRGTIEGIAGFNPGFKSKSGETIMMMIVSVKDAVPVSLGAKK